MAGKNLNKGSVKIKLKFSRNMKMVLLILAAIVLAGVLYQVYAPKPITSWVYRNQTLSFRADLRLADKVPVYPNEDAVYRDLVHGLVENVTIAYKYINETASDGTNPNSYYVLQTVQIVQNIVPAYREGWNFIPQFNSMQVESYENLPGKIQNPIIAIVPPPFSDETAIRNEGHVTLLKAKSYEDLDLVTTKLLMIALKIDLSKTS